MITAQLLIPGVANVAFTIDQPYSPDILDDLNRRATEALASAATLYRYVYGEELDTLAEEVPS